MVRGYIMLEDTSFPLTAISDSARGYLRASTPYMLASDTADIPVDANDSTVLNACFFLVRAPDAPTHAGIEPAAITKWRRVTPDTIRITLFLSPDAGYVARFVVDRGRMSGVGRSWMGREGDAFPPDFIYGRRIGPPDRARCVREIELAAAREHERVRAAIREAQQHRATPPQRVTPR